MAGCQFIHIELYARSASKLAGKARAKKGTKRQASTEDTAWTARQIVAEVRREPGQFSPYIVPQRPEPLYGSADELADELDELDRCPPKGQRKDTPVLLAGVVSSNWHPDDPRSLEWRMDTLAYLKKTHGNNLRAVVAHNDEPHDHMHFYVTLPGLKPVKGLHPGHIARKKSTDAGESPGEQTEAYNAAMKALQDNYYEEVARRHGQTRIGPRRERLGRMEWTERQAQADFIAEVERTTELNRVESVALVDSARHDAQKMIQSAKASSMVIKARDAAEQEEAKKLKEDLVRQRERLDHDKHAFTEEVGTFRRIVKGIYDRLTQFERMEIAPFLGALDKARELVHSVKDKFTSSSKEKSGPDL